MIRAIAIILAAILLTQCTLKASDHVVFWDGHRHVGKVLDTSDCSIEINDAQGVHQSIRCGDVAYVVYDERDTVKYKNDLLLEPKLYFNDVRNAAKQRGINIDSIRSVAKIAFKQKNLKLFAKILVEASDSLPIPCQFSGDDITCHDHFLSFLRSLALPLELQYQQTTWTHPAQTYLLLKILGPDSVALQLRLSMRWLEGITTTGLASDRKDHEEILFHRNMRIHRPFEEK